MYRSFGNHFGVVARAAVVVVVFSLIACAEKFNREDFSARVKDASESRVVAEVGKPYSIEETSPGRVSWTYMRRTFDAAKEDWPDTKAVVIFTPAADGTLRVSEVQFE